MKTLEIRRPNGEIEMVDVTSKFVTIDEKLIGQIRKATKDAGKGDVLRAIITETKSNLTQLIKEYKNVNNEGGDGYVPEEEYFTALPNYKEWIETKEVK